MASSNTFRKELLPPPRSFYEQELGRLTRPNRKGWAQAPCPFHESRSGKSLSVNLQSGKFHCFGCEKHGDIIDFIRLRDGCDFRTAATLLGAWRDERLTSAARIELRKRQQEDQQLDNAVDRVAAAIDDLRLRYRDEIHVLEAIQREMHLRLRYPATVADAESCWAVLEMVLPELREAVAAYDLLSFGSEQERSDFVFFPDLRDATIQAILGRAYVRDDEGGDIVVQLP